MFLREFHTTHTHARHSNIRLPINKVHINLLGHRYENGVPILHQFRFAFLSRTFVAFFCKYFMVYLGHYRLLRPGNFWPGNGRVMIEVTFNYPCYFKQSGFFAIALVNKNNKSGKPSISPILRRDLPMNNIIPELKPKKLTWTVNFNNPSKLLFFL